MIFGSSLCLIQVFRFDVKCCDIHKRWKRRTSGIGSVLSSQRFDCALLGQCMHIISFLPLFPLFLACGFHLERWLLIRSSHCHRITQNVRRLMRLWGKWTKPFFRFIFNITNFCKLNVKTAFLKSCLFLFCFHDEHYCCAMENSFSEWFFISQISTTAICCESCVWNRKSLKKIIIVIEEMKSFECE